METPRIAGGRWSRGELLVGIAVLAVGATFAVTEGAPGAFLAVVLGAVWLAAGTPYAFVAAQVGLVVGLDGGPTSSPVAQAALVGLLLVDAAAGWDLSTGIAALAVASAATAALLAVGEFPDGPVRSAVGILGVTAVAAFAIHRYERVELGLAGDAE